MRKERKAYQSNDETNDWGAREDNDIFWSFVHNFIERLNELLQYNKLRRNFGELVQVVIAETNFWLVEPKLK